MASIKQLYEKRLEAMANNLFLGSNFDDAMEMLPAVGAVERQADDGALPFQESRSLTGTLECNLVNAPRFTGGFDGGTVVNYFGRWIDLELFSEFDQWRDNAKLAKESEKDYFHKFGDVEFQVLPNGYNGGVNFKYIFKWNSFTILISSRAVSEDLPAVQVCYSYESFRNASLFEVRLVVEDFLLSLGFRWNRVSFQRVDFNVTLDVDFQKIVQAFQQGRFVSRLRKFKPELDNTSKGMKCTYIRGGSKNSDAHIVLYDKLAELMANYNDQKFQDLYAVLGDGQYLTRVEFRVFSSFFHTIGVSSYEELEKQLPSIVEYLAASWFRILKKKKVRGKENVQEIDDIWKAVQFAFYKTFVKNDLEIKPLDRKKSFKVTNTRLMRQAVGCLTSAMARSFDSVRDFDQFCIDAFDHFMRYKRLAYKVYKSKRRKYDVSIFKPGLRIVEPSGT